MSLDAYFDRLKHPNPNLREQAMGDIVDHRDETTIDRLMAALGDEDVVFRRASVKTLGAIGPDAVPALVEALLNSESVTVRGSCAKALAQVAIYHRDAVFPQVGLDGLKQSMQDANPVVHIASAMALGQVGEPAVEILMDAIRTTDNLALSVSALNSLGAIQDDRAAQMLTEIAEDESADPYLRETATSALSRLELVKGFQRN
jgi:bilin biosynthesis protein